MPLGGSWGLLRHVGKLLAPLGGLLGTSWGLLAVSWHLLAASWELLGVIFGRSWCLLNGLRLVLGLSWGLLGCSWVLLGCLRGAFWVPSGCLLGANAWLKKLLEVSSWGHLCPPPPCMGAPPWILIKSIGCIRCSRCIMHIRCIRRIGAYQVYRANHDFHMDLWSFKQI